MRRIGVLMTTAADDPEGQARIAAFLQGLQQWGWTVGGNVRIDIRFGADNAATRKHASDSASLAPDVILAMPIPSSEGKSAAQTDGTHAHAQHACRDNDFDVDGIRRPGAGASPGH
jgi:putative ABC transport system substrate-binding protein